MSSVHNEVYLHLVWATWDRLPTLSPSRRERAFEEMVRKAAQRRCPVLAINGVEDHVHVLLHFATTNSIADLVHDLKGSSAWLLNQDGEEAFRWQGGYGVFPIAPNAIDRVAEYIQKQEEHHRQETLNALLEL
jgi:putative transposase